MILALHLTMLRDDKGYFPPYEAAIAVRGATVKANPALHEALAELSGKFSTEKMRAMNYEADGKHRAVRDVAKDFLEKEFSRR